MSKLASRGRHDARRPIQHDDYDPTVSDLHVGNRPTETLPLTRHLHELWQVLGLDDEDGEHDDAGEDHE